MRVQIIQNDDIMERILTSIPIDWIITISRSSQFHHLLVIG